MDSAEYCRQVEAYLCRKNEGHLIRIVGPAFEQVSGWETQGVPIAIVYRGIDQYCERYYAKGPRRRPVRIEFCEADILSLFDDWRRAVGVTRETDASGESASRKGDSLPAHIDRVIARLTTLRASRPSPTFDARLDAAVRELDRLRATAKQARGEGRAEIISRLEALDRELLEAARVELSSTAIVELQGAAEAEIAPFAARMPADARSRAVTVAFDRLVRDAVGLPTMSHEP